MGQSFVIASEETFMGATELSSFQLWSTMFISFFLLQFGGALMFVPSLPLMQSEVRHHGPIAVEQVAEIFVTSMTFGEMAGPLFGGWLVGCVGFSEATCILSFFYLPLFFLALCTYDPAIVTERRRWAKMTAPLVEAKPIDEPDEGFCGPRCSANGTVSDGDGAFAVRRIP